MTNETLCIDIFHAIISRVFFFFFLTEHDRKRQIHTFDFRICALWVLPSKREFEFRRNLEFRYANLFKNLIYFHRSVDAFNEFVIWIKKKERVKTTSRKRKRGSTITVTEINWNKKMFSTKIVDAPTVPTTTETTAKKLILSNGRTVGCWPFKRIFRFSSAPKSAQEIYFESRGKCCKKLLRFNGCPNKVTFILPFPFLFCRQTTEII